MLAIKKALTTQPRMTYVPRLSSVLHQKIQPFPSDEHPPQISESISRHIPFESPQTTETTVPSSNESLDPPKKYRTPTPPMDKLSTASEPIKVTQKDPSTTNGFKKWFSGLTPKQKTIFKVITALLIITGVTAGVMIPVYLFVIRPTNQNTNQQSSSANITTSICSATTCIGKETPYRTSMVTVLYPFDGNPSDLSGYAIGIPFGSSNPSYTGVCYVGSYSLYLQTAFAQYIQIPSMNLAQSFTIQMWLYPMNVANDYGIFSQCDTNGRCLSISLRYGRLALSFDSMNTSNVTLLSSAVLNINIWTHLTVVYDAVLYQQQMYVNGVIDSVSSGVVAPYGTTLSGTTTTVGRGISFAYGTTYYQGYLDHLTISAGSIRTSCQIFNDASLVAYYPFGTTATFNDYSVNLFQGTTSSVTLINHDGFGQALYFTSPSSYFQAQCFPNTRIGNVPFSLSIWIKPDNYTFGGSVIHISNLQNGGGQCYDLLAFTSYGSLVVQLMQTAVIVNGAETPIIPTNTWTHVAIVYSTTNNLRIFINGQLNTVSASVIGSAILFTTPQFLTLGNNSPLSPSASISCRNGSIPIMPGSFRGAIDDFRMYSRELNTQEICVLAGL